ARKKKATSPLIDEADSKKARENDKHSEQTSRHTDNILVSIASEPVDQNPSVTQYPLPPAPAVIVSSEMYAKTNPTPPNNGELLTQCSSTINSRATIDTSIDTTIPRATNLIADTELTMPHDVTREMTTPHNRPQIPDCTNNTGSGQPVIHDLLQSTDNTARENNSGDGPAGMSYNT
ncbi:MAG: hypothetical protein ABW185_10460, partial [Sedimenticola sp.]